MNINGKPIMGEANEKSIVNCNDLHPCDYGGDRLRKGL